MDFAEQFRAARKQRRLTQEALARRLGLSLSGIQSLESGRAEPSLKSLVKITREMGVTFTFNEGGKRVVVGLVGDLMIVDEAMAVKRRR
jgi:transcriptional regulator with XRE-family HTH domain